VTCKIFNEKKRRTVSATAELLIVLCNVIITILIIFNSQTLIDVVDNESTLLDTAAIYNEESKEL